MSKIELNTSISDFGWSQINTNFQKIEDEFNQKVFYRDNPVGEPNNIITLTGTDQNNTELYNASAIRTIKMFVQGVDVTASVLAGAAANNLVFASPPPIGNTVPNTGAFTSLSSNGVAVVTLTGSQTLTNKTLTLPIITQISNTGTLTLPTSSDTLVGRATVDTLTNKTLTAPVISSIVNTGTLTLPTATDTLVGRATTDTLTNKTLTAPTISTITNGGTLTLPVGTDTLVGRNTTDTLTNKTLTSPAINTPTTVGGTINNTSVGATTPNTGAFTSLTSTSGAVNGTVGATTPNTGSFTTLSVSSTVSGAGITSLFASPPAIGGTAPAAGAFTTLSASSNAKVIAGHAGSQTIASGGSGTVVTTWTELLDVGNNFNNSTGVFTAPVAGQYQVSASIGISGPTWAAGNLIQVLVFKNGASYKAGTYVWPTSNTGGLGVANVAILVDCALNDTISIAAFQNGTGSGTTSAALGTGGNYLSIVRIP